MGFVLVYLIILRKKKQFVQKYLIEYKSKIPIQIELKNNKICS